MLKQALPLLALLLCPGARLLSADCNHNGREDGLDIESGASGDCNRDGVPDECELRPSLVLLEGDAIRLDPPVRHAALSDMDGDRDLDLAVAGGNQVSVYGNDGDGIFAQSFLRFGLANAVHVTPADLDADGDLDLVSADEGTQELLILFNDGEGRFPGDGRFPLNGPPSEVIAADLDGDGDQDLAVLHALQGVISIALNDGRGALRPGEVVSSGTSAGAIAAGDLNEDGLADLAVSQIGTVDAPGSMVRVFLSRGGGAFTLPVDLRTGLSPAGLAAADLDRDGRLDLAAASSRSDELSIFWGHGDGAFDDPMTLKTGEAPASVLANDLNGDALMDLAVSKRPSESIDVFFGSGKRSFVSALDFGYVTSGLKLLDGDLDGDGDIDLLVAGTSLSEYINKGEGSFEFRYHNPYGLRKTAVGCATGDLDGDGDTDIAVSNQGYGDDNDPGSLVVLWNRGDGTFPWAVNMKVNESSRSVATGDIDGDQNLDLVTATAKGVSVFLNRGEARFAAPVALSADEVPTAVAAGDLDGDRDVDLALAAPFSVVILFNQDGGSFGPEVKLLAGSNPISIALGDLDGDGDPDLATANAIPGNPLPDNVSVFLNDGQGGFAQARNYAGAGTHQFISSLDGDGDGDLDLLLSDPVFSNVASLLWNLGNATFTPPQLFEKTGIWSAAGGDLNGDGVPDVAAMVSYQVEAFFGQRPAAAAADRNQNGVPDSCEGPPFRRGDPDGDGETSITDAIFLLSHLFLGGHAPACRESADANNDGRLDISDGLTILTFLFLGGARPPDPGPPPSACGLDPDPPGSPRDLGCEVYSC